MTRTLSPYLQLVQDFRDTTAGPGTWADIAALCDSVNATPETVGLLACVSTHRDMSPLFTTNQAVALECLAEADPEGTAHAVHRFTHWACGWIDYVVVSTQRQAVTEVCADIMQRIEAYPLLDEERSCAAEWDANHPAPGECYSDAESDCPCREDAAA